MAGRSRIFSLHKEECIFAGLLITAFMFAYFGTVISLMKTWSGRNDYSHGFIVPFASLYFVYAMRDKLKRIDIEPCLALGLAVTMVGALLLMLGNSGGISTIQQFSILVVIPGLVIMLLGIEMFKALLLPLGYLVLMVPLILDVTLSPLHWPFQLFGANIAALILGALGIPVYHSAQYIELPNTSLEVANACSGIRYLVSIVALAIPLAYLSQKTWPRKIALVTLSIIIGILANPVRIAIIGLWVYGGGSILHGPGHILQGYFVSVVGFVFLFLTAFIMSKPALRGIRGTKANSFGKAGRSRKKGTDIQGSGMQSSEENNRAFPNGPAEMMKQKNAWLSAIVIMVGAGFFVHFYEPEAVRLKGSTDMLPMTLGGWTARAVDHDDGGIVTLPGPDKEIRRSYSAISDDTLQLMLGYYEYQLQGKEFIHYTLQKLYEQSEDCRIRIAEGQHISARQVVIKEGGRRHLVTYWYEIDGFATSNNVVAKLMTAVRGIVKWRTNGAIVLIASDLNAVASVNSARRQHELFIAAIYPFLSAYLSSD